MRSCLTVSWSDITQYWMPYTHYVLRSSYEYRCVLNVCCAYNKVFLRPTLAHEFDPHFWCSYFHLPFTCWSLCTWITVNTQRPCLNVKYVYQHFELLYTIGNLERTQSAQTSAKQLISPHIVTCDFNVDRQTKGEYSCKNRQLKNVIQTNWQLRELWSNPLPFFGGARAEGP